jgi:hypothetical protein
VIPHEKSLYVDGNDHRLPHYGDHCYALYVSYRKPDTKTSAKNCERTDTFYIYLLLFQKSDFFYLLRNRI